MSLIDAAIGKNNDLKFSVGKNWTGINEKLNIVKTRV